MLVSQSTEVKGVITDEVGEPIPYAHVSIGETGLGNIANQSGVFVLKFPASFCEESLTVSCVGYESIQVSLDCNQENLTVRLKVNVIELNSILINGLTAKGIVKEAIARLDSNYQVDSITYTIFGRVTETVRKGPVLLKEFVFDMAHAHKQKPGFFIRKIRARSYNQLGERRLEEGRLLDIHRIENHLMLRYTPNFLQARKMKKYNYQFEGEQRIDGFDYYVITVDSDEYLKGGELWISKDDYGIAYLEKRYENEDFRDITKSETIQQSYYSREEGKWIFTHGARSVNYYLKKEQVLLTKEAITVVINNPVNSDFDKKDEMGLMVQKMENFAGSFDDDFWEQYNYVPLDSIFLKIH